MSGRCSNIQSQQDYYAKSLADSMHTEQPFAAGLRVFDISKPASPREIAFLDMPGFGAHRIWWVGGRYAYVSVHFEGFIDHVLAVIDVSNPAKPALAGRWWLPGMHRAGGETPPASFGKRTALHHLITAGNLGYAAWRDGGLTVHDLSDPAHPKLLAHRNTSPPFAGGAHTPLPLPDRNLVVLADEATSVNCANGLAYTWIYDVRTPDNPVTIATLPTPTGEDFCAKGGKFGPHNLHENRPGSLQRSDIVFATYHNAGLRVFDISNQFEPKEIALFRAAAAGKDRRPAAEPGQGHPVLRRVCRPQRRDVSHRHQCRPLHPAIRGTIAAMTEKFGRLALHMWTIDTTPLKTALDAAKQGGFDAVELRRTDFKRCFDAGMSNAQVLDLIRASGIPVGVLGVEYGWLFATGDESKRLFKVFRESCENAVALGCTMLMSAPGQVNGPIKDAIKYLKDAGDIAAEYKLKLAIEFNSQHDVLNSLAVLTELIEGADKPNCGYLIDAYHFTRSGAGGRGFESVPADKIYCFQYSDVSPNPVTGVRRPTDRLAPGKGIVKWREMLGLLAEKNYTGYLSYEAPNPGALGALAL